MPRKPKLAFWKFASCDGCQVTLLDCEDQLLAVAGAIEIANFPEASSAIIRGPYDISLVEGSITTPREAEHIHRIRRSSRFLVAMGACASSGGIQALRNFKDVKEFISLVYARPEYIDTLNKSTPMKDHIKVDLELQGCPPNKYQLLEVLFAFLHGRKPNIPPHALCLDCKRKGIVCVMVANAIPCMGPVTQAGCGVLCPSYHRGCYSCFGPMETPNTGSLSSWFEQKLGLRKQEIVREFRTMYGWSEPYRKESEAQEKQGQQ
jgi:sulfhydrogenase subunit delta